MKYALLVFICLLGGHLFAQRSVDYGMTVDSLGKIKIITQIAVDVDSAEVTIRSMEKSLEDIRANKINIKKMWDDATRQENQLNQIIAELKKKIRPAAENGGK